MKKLTCLLLCLALCCALFACGGAGAGPESISWRELDLQNIKNRGTRKWLEKNYVSDWNRRTEFPLGNGTTLVAKGGPEIRPAILLRDNKTKREDVLLQGIEQEIYYLQIHEILDKRYFLFAWGFDWGYQEVSVYDLQERKEIPVVGGLHYLGRRGDAIYFNCTAVEIPYSGTLHLYQFDWTTLYSNEKLKPVDLLAGIPHETVCEVYENMLTENGRYYIVFSENEVCVFDLWENILALRTELESLKKEFVWRNHILKDNHTLLCLVYDWGEDRLNRYALEITLP